MKTKLIIQFLKGENPDFSQCTKIQAETYQVAWEMLHPGKKVPTGDILARLKLQDPRPFYSRLNHLKEKGLIRWGKSQPAMI
jgi:hypothetical protein